MTTLSQFFPSGSSGGGGDTIPATTTVAEVLLVGGGGGAAKNCNNSITYSASGGTAGGVLISTKYCFEQGCTYTIAIGAGGASPPYSPGCPGTPSSIVGYGVSLTAFGAYICGRNNFTLQLDQHTTHLGNPAGRIGRICSPTFCHNVGAGGGGALMRGDSGCRWLGSPPYSLSAVGGPGGDGIASNISGTECYYGGGGSGGGGPYSTCPIARENPWAGLGGGGCAAAPAGTNGTANTGGGGGGGLRSSNNGGSGGSGVLFIRYPTDYRAAPGTTGNTPTPAQPGYNVYRWNGDGSITF